jgi:hypothetical protein
MRLLLVTAYVVPSSPILATLMMEALGSTEMSVLTRTIWRSIPEDGILHRQMCSTLRPCQLRVILLLTADLDCVRSVVLNA